MKIILNNQKQIRAIDFDQDTFYTLSEIEFYIPKSFNINEIFCVIEEYNVLSFNFIKEYNNYNIYQIKQPDDLFLHRKGYFIGLKGKLWDSNFLKVNLQEVNSNPYEMEIGEKSNVNFEDTPVKMQVSNKIILKNVIHKIVQGDSKSTIINFYLNKEYDKENLYLKHCRIYMKNSLGEINYQEINADKITDNQDGTIVVKWVLDDFACAHQGALLYSLYFYNVPNNGYIWQTEVSTLDISKGLLVRTSDVESYQQELDEWAQKHLEYEKVDMRDEHPTLNVDDRNILIGENKNIIVQGDNESQLISFRIKRFQDEVDLKDKIITIKYINANGKAFRTGVVNRRDEEESIFFSWKISHHVTEKEGSVAFAIEVIGKINSQTSQADYYIWQTLPSFLIISKGLTGPFIEETPPNWYEDILDKIGTINNKILELEKIDVSSLQLRIAKLEEKVEKQTLLEWKDF